MLLKLDHLGLGVPTLLLHVPQGVLGAEADVDVLRDEEEGWSPCLQVGACVHLHEPVRRQELCLVVT